jgi:hypothetical protein
MVKSGGNVALLSRVIFRGLSEELRVPDESKTPRRRKVDLADQYRRIGIKSVAAAVRRQKQKNIADRFSKSQERKGTDLKRS